MSNYTRCIMFSYTKRIWKNLKKFSNNLSNAHSNLIFLIHLEQLLPNLDIWNHPNKKNLLIMQTLI
jgi:hypothetical protein